MKEQLDIIKIGGNIIDNEYSLDAALENFAQNKNRKILVHGGGKMATRFSQKLGIKSNLVNGRRITSDEDLELVTMVYAGLINKKIVAKLQALSCNAIGLSGCDGGSILAEKRQHSDIDYGFVGDIGFVNSAQIDTLITNGFYPVFSAITHDGKGQLLNTNADTIAAKLSIAFAQIYEVRLLYCFEKDGVLSDPGDEFSVIPFFDESYFKELKMNGFISEGMIPKLDNCFDALEQGVLEVFIGNSDIINNKAQNFTKLTLK